MIYPSCVPYLNSLASAIQWYNIEQKQSSITTTDDIWRVSVFLGSALALETDQKRVLHFRPKTKTVPKMKFHFLPETKTKTARHFWPKTKLSCSSNNTRQISTGSVLLCEYANDAAQI